MPNELPKVPDTTLRMDDGREAYKARCADCRGEGIREAVRQWDAATECPQCKGAGWILAPLAYALDPKALAACPPFLPFTDDQKNSIMGMEKAAMEHKDHLDGEQMVADCLDCQERHKDRQDNGERCGMDCELCDEAFTKEAAYWGTLYRAEKQQEDDPKCEQCGERGYMKHGDTSDCRSPDCMGAKADHAEFMGDLLADR